MHDGQRSAAKPRSVRVSVATGKHHWTFQCDRSGCELLDAALVRFAGTAGSGLTEADALIVRRTIGEALGLVPKFPRARTQD